MTGLVTFPFATASRAHSLTVTALKSLSTTVLLTAFLFTLANVADAISIIIHKFGAISLFATVLKVVADAVTIFVNKVAGVVLIGLCRLSLGCIIRTQSCLSISFACNENDPQGYH